jgi:hypothetical protein
MDHGLWIRLRPWLNLEITTLVLVIKMHVAVHHDRTNELIINASCTE